MSSIFYLIGLLALRTLSFQSDIYPGKSWETKAPEEAGLSSEKLHALATLVGGRGCVIRRGYLVYAWGEGAKSGDVASAVKPVISHLLLVAVQEGKLRSADDPVVEFEPRLRMLNGGKDEWITWRHLASQTSGYGLVESPGAAWAYNDSALALYYDTLTEKVFQQNGTTLLRKYLADVLQFEDSYTFEAFGPQDRPGRLAISVRDFARFGLLYLRDGRWNDKQVLREDLVRLALSSPVAPETPPTSAKEAEMLPNQRTLGGGKNITRTGPGYYSFNWWLNRLDEKGSKLYVSAPADTIVASGHGGKRTLWIIPSLDLIVCWNDSAISDHDASPGNADSMCNRAARLMVESIFGESRGKYGDCWDWGERSWRYIGRGPALAPANNANYANAGSMGRERRRMPMA